MEKFQMITINRIAYIFCALTLIATACVREEFELESASDDIKMVDVSLNLFVARETSGTKDTKSIDDQTDVHSTIIRNINVLQFNGTDDNAPIVGEVQYLSDTAEKEEDKLQIDPKTNKISMIKLADSEGQKHTIVILTNTFEKLIQVGTLGEMKALFRTIYKDSDVFGHEGDAKDFPDGETIYYQRMNAIAVTDVVQGTVLRANLRRSMSRIKLHIENDLDHSDNLRIKSVQLVDVSAQDYYLTDYRYIADPVTRTEEKLYEYDFQDNYDPTYPRRIDYDKIEWNGDVVESEGGRKEVADYTFYVPANQRGVYLDNVLPQEKNRCPNVDGATHVRICATYGPEGNEEDIVYTFYLGANLVNDFNICPNTSYTYNLRFSGKGNSKVDNRIDDLATVHFGVDANCYILPIPEANERSYTFNAIHRPNIFWGPDRYGLYSKYPNYIVDNEKKWKARIIWSDLKLTKEQVSAFLVKSSGDGKGGYMDMNQRIKVTVPSSLGSCNVIVGMYLDDPDNIMWSWHLWITDYNPDDIVGHAPVYETVTAQNDTVIKFIYPVTGGEVHRYNGESWQSPSGKYYKGYIMDRALGALYPRMSLSERGSGLTYNWGRKDPFRKGTYSVWMYDKDGNPTESKTEFPTIPDKYAEEFASCDGVNIPFTVNHPTLKIGTAPIWKIDDPMLIWNDPKRTERVENEESGEGNKDKSMFDPCPPGWRVPMGIATGGFTYLNNGKVPVSSNCYSDLLGCDRTDPKTAVIIYSDEDKKKHFLYYPMGYINEKDNPHPQVIHYTSSGEYFYLVANLHNNYNSFGLRVSLNHGDCAVYAVSRAGLSYIRCVKENYLL